MRVDTKLQPGQGSRTLALQLSDLLRHAIVKGQFPPGSRLPSEANLTETHGVSRTVVREAMATLRADRLVVARQGSGVFVLDAPGLTQMAAQSIAHVDLARVSSVIELLELRTAIEVEAAGLAALRRSPAQDEFIIERHSAVRASLEASLPTSEADLALHLAIADASNNPRFREFLDMIGRNLIPRSALQQDLPEKDHEAYIILLDHEHDRIVTAISAGDEEGAREAMRSHLRGSQSRYRTLLRELRERAR